MKNSKLFPAMILGLAALIVLITVIMIRESGNPDPPEQIHVIVDNSSDNRWVQFIAGMQKAAEDQKVKLTVVPTGSFHSIAEEKKLVESAAAEGADGVILQLISDRNAAAMLEEISGKIHVELVDNGETETMGYTTGIVSPDHKAMGKTLAEEVTALYRGALDKSTIGVLQINSSSSAMRQRTEGFTEELEAQGGQIAWKLEMTANSRSMKEMLADQDPPDILVALDNASLETAGEYAAAQEKDILVVGTGTSTKAIYYLDSGAVQSMVVPEDFMMGYQSVTDLTNFIRRDTFLPQIRNVQYRVIHRDTLFADENQGILFPIQN